MSDNKLDRVGWIVCMICIVIMIVSMGIVFVNIREIYQQVIDDIAGLQKQNEKLYDDIEELSYQIDTSNKIIEDLKKNHRCDTLSRGIITRGPSYNINNLTERSNITREQLGEKLEGTPLHDVAGSYILAEEEYNINAIFLCALSIQESGWGRSKLAQNKNNIFGYSAYNNSPYKSAMAFSSKHDCIMTVGGKIAENYLNEDGKYYNGRSLDAVNTRYSLDENGNPNGEWNRNIRSLMKKLGSIDK